MEKKTVIEADHGEIEDLAKKHYSLDHYEFVAAQCCGNDTSHRFRVEPAFNQIEWDEAVWKEFEYRNFVLLNRLCHDGHIEPGEYYVRVSW